MTTLARALGKGLLIMVLLASASGCRSESPAGGRDYRFDRTISRPVLENYLSRAITMSEFLHGKGSVDDNLRLLVETGVKFVGRAIYRWGAEADLEFYLSIAAPIAQKVHQADPEMILQAAIFEIVTTQVNRIPLPAWVLQEYGLPAETRTFRYADMLYEDGRRKNQWARNQSVPDMSRIETQMWFFYLAARYIDVGCEAIHFGQVEIMDERDKAHEHWQDMLDRVRRFAAQHARRHMVLCDAHVPSGGLARRGRLLFDFHSFPLRIAPVPDKPQQGVLQQGYVDSIYGRSLGGTTPSGWECEHLPYLVELDNWGRSGHEGENFAPYWIWGYDEISWFAHQSAAYRAEWLRYAWAWLRENDPNGHLQMPGSRTLAATVGSVDWYWANRPSASTPDGFGDEDAIRAIWAEDL